MMFDTSRLDTELRHALASFRHACGTLRHQPTTEVANPISQRLVEAERRAELTSHPAPDARALAPWLDALASERQAWPDRLSLARLWHEPRRTSHHSGRRSAHQLRALLLAAPQRRQRSVHGASFAELAGALSTAHLRALQRRTDGDGAGLLRVAEAGSDQVGAAAAELLRRTEDAARQRQHPGWVEGLHRAIGREADEGWPARLRPRWLAETFAGSGLAGRVNLDRIETTAAWGGSSFCRALGLLGVAVLDVGRPAAMPLALHQHPWGTRRHKRHALFAALPLELSFAHRILGLGRHRAEDHRRTLAGALLCSLRLDAFRVVLAAAWPGGTARLTEQFAEVSEQLFSQPAPPTLLGVLPQLRPGDGPCFIGTLQSLVQRDRLVGQFDEDWFRNPAAIGWLEQQDTLPRAEERLDHDGLTRLVDRTVRWADELLA